MPFRGIRTLDPSNQTAADRTETGIGNIPSTDINILYTDTTKTNIE